MAKIQLNIKINENAKYHNQLEREVIQGLKNLDKSSINQGKPEKNFIHTDEYYKNQIFNGNLDDLNNIHVGFEVTDSRNTEKMDIWNYFRYYVSSMKFSRSVGIQMYILVKDLATNKYLGIMMLGSDYYNLAERDKYIGWDEQTRKQNLKYVLNIKACVPLQPFGFNFTGGKLLAKLAFSRELSELFIRKISSRTNNPQEYPILAITTTSLYGKGCQYKDLDELKYVGLSKGESSLHISDELYQKCKELCDLKDITFGTGTHARSKTVVIKKLLPHLNLSRDVLQHEYQRGIYLGYLYPNSKQLLTDLATTDQTALNLTNMDQLSPAQEIFNNWLPTATKRYNSLRSNKKLKKKVNMYKSQNEQKRVEVANRRNEKIMELGRQNIQPDQKQNEHTIRKVGLEIVRTEERAKKKSIKSSFHQKYDLSKIDQIKFDKRNQHLEQHIPKLVELIKENEYLTNLELSKQIGIKYDSLRSLLEHIKF